MKALKEGSEWRRSDDVYFRTIIYNGHKIIVRFVKDASGFVLGIGTAYVK
jgi:hypothetical protein